MAHEQAPARTTIQVRRTAPAPAVAGLDEARIAGDRDRRLIALANALAASHLVVRYERRRADAAEARVRHLQEHNLQLLAHVERLQRRGWWRRILAWWRR